MLISAEVDVIRLLADPLREQIVELLAEQPACTCHLVEDTGAKQPTVSHHLKVLREAGLVEAEPYGRYTYYRVVPEVLDRTASRIAALADRARATSGDRRECA
ncbi:ArsR/SmtB family transcription factor [Microlunatus sp. GCM10028923]|uniref:ArsR/SmtB family transcription factor n=1 Tax=Microlunatus sp. GCM10028923 TaxID=3273400 RepID=UPI0036132283